MTAPGATEPPSQHTHLSADEAFLIQTLNESMKL